MKNLSITSSGNGRRWLIRLLLMALLLMGSGLSARAEAPKVTGYCYEPGELLFPFRDTIKVTYSAPVIKTYWAMEQDGKTVLEGTCDGKAQNQPNATIKMKTLLSNAMANKTVKPGDIKFKITKVDYYDENEGEISAENLGSIDWVLTDAPLCNSMQPYPKPAGKGYVEVKENTTCTFQGPSGTLMGNSTQLVQVKARVLQNGNTLAEEVLFKGTKSASTGKYGNSAGNKLGTDPVWEKIEPGIFEIQFYEVTYISPVDGTEKTLNMQPALPAKWYYYNNYYDYRGQAITYGEKKASAVSDIIEESLPAYTGEILSYYPKEGTDGVITYKSSKPVDPTSLKAELSYGNMDIPFTTRVPVSVSEDGYLITLDLRGMVNSAYRLTNGHTFTDDSGNPTSGPTDISVELTGLKSTSGANLCTIWSASNGVKQVLYGRMWRTYKFKDLSFKTPVLFKAQFYDNAAPDAKSDAIIASSNTMDLTVDGGDVITSADMVFTAGEVKATVANSDITRSGDIWTVALPAAVKEAGSSQLIVGLENVVYNKVDGEEHVIEPLDVAKNGGSIRQVATVEDIKALDSNTDFMLNTETLKVTLADPDQGLVMVEDETGGLMLDPSGDTPFTEGKLVKGSIVGTYLGASMFTMKVSRSNYTEETTDISRGLEIEDAVLLMKSANLYRLITVTANDDLPLVYSEDAEGVVIGEDLMVARDALSRIPANYSYPANIASVTGIYYQERGQSFLIMRSTDDVVAAAPQCKTIAEALALEMGTEVVLDLTDAKATFMANGASFVEDASAGAMMGMADGESVFAARGELLNGKVKVVNGGNVLVVTDKSGLTVGQTDVTLGKVIKGTEVTANASRLVTFTAENNEFAVDAESGMVMVDGAGVVMDLFGVLPEGYVWPEKIATLTGVVYDTGMGYIVMIRDANDIVAASTTPEVKTIAELKALPEGTQAVLVLDGHKVTHQMEGYNFIEDETGAIIIPEIALSQRGKALTGTIKGVAAGPMAFYVQSTEDVNLTAEVDADVKFGVKLTADDLSKPENAYRLVTFTKGDGYTITGDNDMEMINVGGMIYAVDQTGALPADYRYPDRIESVTGILWPNEVAGYDEGGTPTMSAFIVIRDADDIVADDTDGIEGILIDGKTAGDVYNVNGVKVRNAGESLNGLATGVYIINGSKVFIQR